MSKKLMVLGAGIMQVPIISEAKKLGYQILAVDYDKNAPGLTISDVPLLISTLDRESVLNEARVYSIDGILTTSDLPVLTVSYICKHLGLIGLSEDAAEVTTDKYRQRKRFSENNLPIPEYINVGSINEIQSFSEKVGFPIIIKPVDSSASKGISGVNTKSDIDIAYKHAQQHSSSGKVIAEKLIQGREFSVEVLIQDHVKHVIAVTEKSISGTKGKYFVEDRHVIPAEISNLEYESIVNIVSKAVDAIGLNNSAAHVEIMITNSGPYIIEVASRLGGDFITSDLVPLSTGVNMLENVINISIGKPINTKKTIEKYAGVQFITSENYIAALKHLDSISSSECLVRYKVKKRKGGEQLRSSHDRLGYYICHGLNRVDLQKVLNI